MTPEVTPSGKNPIGKKTRTGIPMAIRHEVWSRDEGRCTGTEVDGSRCQERFMLELDHVQTMHCHGGTHDVENLALTCRRHNQLSAKQRLGEDFWQKKRQLWDKSLKESLNVSPRDETLVRASGGPIGRT
jgi:5-methylcytosine-specific restriction endonuclease McrA